VLVVVALVLGVPVLVVQVVDVIAVLHCHVAATFSVYMISMLVRYPFEGSCLPWWR